jgi:hypothetical protein
MIHNKYSLGIIVEKIIDKNYMLSFMPQLWALVKSCPPHLHLAWALIPILPMALGIILHIKTYSKTFSVVGGHFI